MLCEEKSRHIDIQTYSIDICTHKYIIIHIPTYMHIYIHISVETKL